MVWKRQLYRVGFEHEQINAQVKEIKDNIYTTRVGTSTLSLESLFRYLTVKKFYLMSNLNLFWRSLRLYPLILSLVTGEKELMPWLQPPFRIISESCDEMACLVKSILELQV
ncbi:hypothetical protein TURU_128041 [Turdus rufiventris]|nr:hypothetical protein TURU_128041 [Turdus rufiventris]